MVAITERIRFVDYVISQIENVSFYAVYVGNRFLDGYVYDYEFRLDVHHTLFKKNKGVKLVRYKNLKKFNIILTEEDESKLIEAMYVAENVQKQKKEEYDEKIQAEYAGAQWWP